jgi:hypothetical protein
MFGRPALRPRAKQGGLIKGFTVYGVVPYTPNAAKLSV